MVTRAGPGALRRELRLDTEPGEPVGQVADGLVVGEVGLPDHRSGRCPAPRNRRQARIGQNLELLAVNGLGPNDNPRAGRSGAPRGRAATISASANRSLRQSLMVAADTAYTG